MENQNESLIKQYVKRRAKRRLFLWLFGTSAGLITIFDYCVRDPFSNTCGGLD